MGHVDPKQAPSKGKPWHTVLAQDFIHKVDLIMPASINEVMQQKLVGERSAPEYSRLTMTLSDILTGDFFTEYIKKGNVLMLSEGKKTVDNMFTLQEGILTIYLDRETYERAGLVGKPYGAKGGRWMKPRWIASYDLRSPAMLHGRKGFDRLVHAAKNVLNQPTIWLFCNVEGLTPSPDPLLKYFPTKFTSSPGVSQDLPVLQPPLDIPIEILATGDRTALEETTTEFYEWLSLIRLGSPRVEPHDDIDPYLSRYRIPEGADEQAMGMSSFCYDHPRSQEGT
ncbi:Fc.00g070330.m01.CDS01 [Cosmosporella sp. VM-42]